MFLNLGAPAASESPVRESVLDLPHECKRVCTSVCSQGYEKTKWMSNSQQIGRKI